MAILLMHTIPNKRTTILSFNSFSTERTGKSNLQLFSIKRVLHAV